MDVSPAMKERGACHGAEAGDLRTITNIGVQLLAQVDD
jgi:hypothetical protein